MASSLCYGLALSSASEGLIFELCFAEEAMKDFGIKGYSDPRDMVKALNRFAFVLGLCPTILQIIFSFNKLNSFKWAFLGPFL